MSNIVVGIIAGSVVALISFALGLFGNMWYANYQENKQRKNEALKKHFEELEEQFIKPASDFLSNFSNKEGVLAYFNPERQYSIDASHTTWPTNNKEQNFSCFKAHFTGTADEILRLEKLVKKNNDANTAFNAEIVALLEQKSGVPVRDYSKKANLKVPFFSPLIIAFIRFSYMEHMRMPLSDKKVDEPKFNFNEVVYSPIIVNIIKVRLKDGRDLAEVNNVNEAEACKKALITISEDINLGMRGRRLYRDTEFLKKWAANLSQNLDIICEQHSKFGKVLKKKKDCPICKLIFEE
jgi:hypothetical protein